MEAILFAVSPILVNIVTQGLKKLQTIEMSANRIILVRYIAALLSFGSVVLGALITGDMPDQTIVTTFVETTVVFVLSQVMYLVYKLREKGKGV